MHVWFSGLHVENATPEALCQFPFHIAAAPCSPSHIVQKWKTVPPSSYVISHDWCCIAVTLPVHDAHSSPCLCITQPPCLSSCIAPQVPTGVEGTYPSVERRSELEGDRESQVARVGNRAWPKFPNVIQVVEQRALRHCCLKPEERGKTMQ